MSVPLRWPNAIRDWHQLEPLMPVSSYADLEEGALQGVRVLVVEDNGQVAAALASVLIDTGMTVTGPAATSHEAERLTIAQSPELALVDLNLGGEQAVGLIKYSERYRKESAQPQG